MISYETLTNVLKSVYSDKETKYEVNSDYNNGKSFTVTIVYPDLNVSNEDGDEIDLENFVIRIIGQLKEQDSTLWYDKFVSIGAYNLCPTEDMIIAGYAHSHVSGLTSSTVCLGATTLHDAFESSKRELNEDVLYDFFTLLDVMVHHESIDGGPYVYIENVHDAEASNDSYRYISEDDYQSFKEDYCVSDRLVEYELDGSPLNFLLQIKDGFNNDTLNDEHKNVAYYIHNLIKDYLNEFNMDLIRYSYVDFYVDNQTKAEKIANSEAYKELLGLFKYVIEEYVLKDKSFTDVMDLIAEFYKSFNNVNINEVYDVSTKTYARVLVDGEVYDQDDLFDLEDVHNYLTDYTSVSDGNDYEYVINHINSLSFFIDGKLYKGEAEPITENHIDFYTYENIEETNKIEGRYEIESAIQAIAKRKDTYHDIIIRNSKDCLASASGKLGQISL